MSAITTILILIGLSAPAAADFSDCLSAKALPIREHGQDPTHATPPFEIDGKGAVRRTGPTLVWIDGGDKDISTLKYHRDVRSSTGATERFTQEAFLEKKNGQIVSLTVKNDPSSLRAAYGRLGVATSGSQIDVVRKVEFEYDFLGRCSIKRVIAVTRALEGDSTERNSIAFDKANCAGLKPKLAGASAAESEQLRICREHGYQLQSVEAKRAITLPGGNRPR